MRVFNPPITISKQDGSTIDVSSVRLVLVDNQEKRLAHVHPLPSDVAIVLWQGDAYDAAGDYTQADIENRFDLLIASRSAAQKYLSYVDPDSRPYVILPHHEP